MLSRRSETQREHCGPLGVFPALLDTRLSVSAPKKYIRERPAFECSENCNEQLLQSAMLRNREKRTRMIPLFLRSSTLQNSTLQNIFPRIEQDRLDHWE